MEGLDQISAEARTIGAVNTIDNRGGQLIGYNTDAYGVIASVRAAGGLNKVPTSVVLLGAGGAARAILYALLQTDEVKNVQLINRTKANAESLAAELDVDGRRVSVASIDNTKTLREAGLLINATSVGMYPQQNVSPVTDLSLLHDRMVVLDIVYKPLRTRLLRQAEAAGAHTIDGLGMLVYQGARSFEIWTDVTAPVNEMRRALQQIQ